MRAPVFALIIAVLAVGPALAGDVTAKGLTIGHPWTRPAAAGGTAAGYLTIANKGAADTLVAVETPLAKTASLHRSQMNGAIMQMRSLDGLAVPAKGTAVLAPGGDHIMFTGLTKSLSQGQKIPVTLVFQRAGRIRIDLAVETSGPPTSPVVNHDHH